MDDLEHLSSIAEPVFKMKLKHHKWMAFIIQIF